MEQCDYWWENEATEWCDLIAGSCNCAGLGQACSLNAHTVQHAFQEEEKITLREAGLRARKRRAEQQQAS